MYLHIHTKHTDVPPAALPKELTLQEAATAWKEAIFLNKSWMSLVVSEKYEKEGLKKHLEIRIAGVGRPMNILK